MSNLFFPYITENGISIVDDVIRCNPPVGNHAWIYILILLFGASSWAIYNTKLLSKKEQYMREAPLVGAIGVIGIIVFTYYMNEAHWGCMDIVHQVAACLVSIILFKLWPLMKKAGNSQFWHQMLRAVVILATGVFSTLAVSFFNDPIIIAARHSAGAYSFQGYMEDVESLANNVPTNTFGIGQGINMIYHTLGWNNHLSMRDTTILEFYGGDAYEKALKTVLNQNSFLISGNSTDEAILVEILLRDSSYTKENEFQINGWPLYYYVRKDGKGK